MDRPYIICHMVTSVDGKVTGDFLSSRECEKAIEIYYEINRNYKPDGFICGRVTMEGSFTGGWYPDLSECSPCDIDEDFIPDKLTGFYAVSFDPKGKLGWKEKFIVDDDPGYGNAQIVEVITESVDKRYLGYLREKGIAYIFAGKTEIDVETALAKLKNLMGINTLLLEGGSIVNGYFERADAVDELSLVVAPTVASCDDKPLFMNSTFSSYELKEIKQHGSVIWLNYRRMR